MAFEIIMPKLGVDMQEGEIIEWKKQEGDVVNEGDILLEIMSDKINMELEAEDSGVLLKITRQAGETVPVTEVIGYIGAEGEVVADNAAIAPAAEAAPQVEKVADVETPAAKPQPQVAIVHEGGKIRATPKARKVAREMGIDIAQVLGTGAKGRIHADDVENFKEKVANRLSGMEKGEFRRIKSLLERNPSARSTRYSELFDSFKTTIKELKRPGKNESTDNE